MKFFSNMQMGPVLMKKKNMFAIILINTNIIRFYMFQSLINQIFCSGLKEDMLNISYHTYTSPKL